MNPAEAYLVALFECKSLYHAYWSWRFRVGFKKALGNMFHNRYLVCVSCIVDHSRFDYVSEFSFWNIFFYSPPFKKKKWLKGWHCWKIAISYILPLSKSAILEDAKKLYTFSNKSVFGDVLDKYLRSKKRHDANILQKMNDFCAQMGPARRTTNECSRLWKEFMTAAVESPNYSLSSFSAIFFDAEEEPFTNFDSPGFSLFF